MANTKTYHAKIDEHQFDALVRGEAITLSNPYPSQQDITVRVILADIGWSRMLWAIDQAMNPKLRREEGR